MSLVAARSGGALSALSHLLVAWVRRPADCAGSAAAGALAAARAARWPVDGAPHSAASAARTSGRRPPILPRETTMRSATGGVGLRWIAEVEHGAPTEQIRRRGRFESLLAHESWPDSFASDRCAPRRAAVDELVFGKGRRSPFSSARRCGRRSTRQVVAVAALNGRISRFERCSPGSSSHEVRRIVGALWSGREQPPSVHRPESSRVIRGDRHVVRRRPTLELAAARVRMGCASRRHRPVLTGGKQCSGSRDHRSGRRRPKVERRQ